MHISAITSAGSTTWQLLEPALTRCAAHSVAGRRQVVDVATGAVVRTLQGVSLRLLHFCHCPSVWRSEPLHGWPSMAGVRLAVAGGRQRRRPEAAFGRPGHRPAPRAHGAARWRARMRLECSIELSYNCGGIDSLRRTLSPSRPLRSARTARPSSPPPVPSHAVSTTSTPAR